MRRGHLEALRPACPSCRGRTPGPEVVPLQLAHVARSEGEHVLEGILHCERADCRREHPILDGVPYIVADLRGRLAPMLDQVTTREDLSPDLESLLADCAGPGSAFQVAREHLSTYAWDHYGDLDPDERQPGGSLVRLVHRGLEMAGGFPAGPVMDLGCAVGRASFTLADRTGRLTVGVDLAPRMLRLAGSVLRGGRVRYPRRRIGVVHDRREFDATLPASSLVDFWAADALDLPFADATFGLIAALNVIDCVASPIGLLRELARLLVPGGKAIVSTPYDWSPAATALEGWLGGHSQRGPGGGAGETVLRSLLLPGAAPAVVPGFRILSEEPSLPWRVRLHDRSAVDYSVHVLALERTDTPA